MKLTQIAFGWILLYLKGLSVNAEVRLRFVLQVLLKDLLPVLRFPQEDLLQAILGC
jgi:hypothetical protein